MAESRRKSTGHTPAPVIDDDAQARKDRMMLLIFGIGGIIVLAGMWLLAMFLSGK